MKGSRKQNEVESGKIQVGYQEKVFHPEVNKLPREVVTSPNVSGSKSVCSVLSGTGCDPWGTLCSTSGWAQ